MKKFSRFLVLAVIMAAIFACLTFHASAADVVASGYCGGEGDGTNLTWTLDSEGALTISGTGAMKNYNYGSYAPWHSNRSSIKKVTIGDGVTTIGTLAFYDCDSLTSVTIGDSVTTIGSEAFDWCDSLTTVTIGDSVTTIGDSAFDLCESLTSVDIPDSVKTIGTRAFARCDSLTSVDIPDSVKTIGVLAFYWCVNLSRVTIPDGVMTIGRDAFRQCYRLNSIDIPDSVTTIGDRAFSYCKSLTSVTIGNGVRTIGEETFDHCTSLTSVTIGNRVTTIGDIAFQNCDSLTSVEIPDSVTTIGYASFWGCDNLVIVDIPDSVTTIGDSAFRNCTSLTSVIIPDSVTTIGDRVFHNCDSLTSVCFEGNAPAVNAASAETASFDSNVTLYYIPGMTGWTDSEAYDASTGTWNGYKLAAGGYCGGEGDGTNLTWTLDSEGTLTITGSGKMADYAWGASPWLPSRTSLRRVVIGDGVTSIGNESFSGCSNMTAVTIPNSVMSIGKGAFEYCNGLNAVVIPNGVTSIGDWAFYECSGLTALMLPASMRSIGVCAFAYCTGLRSVTIPDSMTSIGNFVFAECPNLMSVYFEGNAPAVNAASAETASFDSNVTLYYIPGTTGWTDSEAYDAETGTWNGYKLEVWKEKAYVAFGYCGGESDGTNLTWTLDSEGTLIITGSGAMENYDLDYSWTLPPWYDYRNNIKTLALPAGLTTIGDSAFDLCESLTSVDIPDSVKTIGTRAFALCDSLTSVDIPDSVKTIGDAAFYWCENLSRVTIPDSVMTIGEAAFSQCLRLNSIDIPDSVTTIGDRAFSFCKSLTSVTIGNGVTTIGEETFDRCRSLTSVTIGNSVTTIGDIAFQDCDSLTSVEIPDSVTTIGYASFWGCDNLVIVTVPDSVTTIGDSVFHNCDSLTSVCFEGNAPAVNAASAETASFDSNVTLYYIPGTTGWTDSEAYDASTGTWNGYKLAIWEEMVKPAILEGKLAAIEVSMDSELLLWLKFNLPAELVGDDDAYAVISADRKSGVQETIVPMAEIRAKGADKNGRYIIEQGMAAPEMGRNVTVSFVDGNGNYVNLTDYVSGEVATSVSRTIVDYSKLALEKGNTKQKNLNRALLAYGGYAQAYFKVDTGAPVYNVLPEFGFEVPSFSEITADTLTQEMVNSGSAGINVLSQQSFLDSAIYHRVYFTLHEGVTIDDLSFELTKRNKAGEYTESVMPVFEDKNGGRYYIQIDDIASPLLDYMYNIRIVNEMTFDEANISTSVLCWLKLGLQKSSNTAQKNMFRAMYNYNKIANSFFGF